MLEEGDEDEDGDFEIDDLESEDEDLDDDLELTDDAAQVAVGATASMAAAEDAPAEDS